VTAPSPRVACSAQACGCAAIGCRRRGTRVVPAASLRIRLRVVGVSCLAEVPSSSAAMAGRARRAGAPAAQRRRARTRTRHVRRPGGGWGRTPGDGRRATGDGRRAIEPVGVLSDNQQRRIGGHLEEQIEDRHRDAKVLGRSDRAATSASPSRRLGQAAPTSSRAVASMAGERPRSTCPARPEIALYNGVRPALDQRARGGTGNSVGEPA
jgi:hypothetical protein